MIIEHSALWIVDFEKKKKKLLKIIIIVEMVKILLH
jgi:hypothetical protein